MTTDPRCLPSTGTPAMIGHHCRLQRTGALAWFFAAAFSMKCGGGDPLAARLLAKWTDGLACWEVTIRTDGEPSICELARHSRKLRAAQATTADEVNSPGAFGANGVAERVILTIGGIVKTTKAAVVDKCTCLSYRWPASHGVGGAPCRSVTQRLFSW